MAIGHHVRANAARIKLRRRMRLKQILVQSDTPSQWLRLWAQHLRARRRHLGLKGSNNPNWQGGISRLHGVYKRRFRAKYPQMAAAHDAVRFALRRGELRRPSRCETCLLSIKPHAHHDDYSRPLEVRWLCRACHRNADLARRARELPQKLNRLYSSLTDSTTSPSL